LRTRIKQKLKNLSMSILVVEDDDFVRRGFVDYLSMLCENILEATNGKEAIEIYKQKEPCIIITDIMMPIVDGLQMAKEIRSLSDEVQIIVFTAFSENELLVKAIESGVNHYLFKPLSTELFLSVLNKSIDDVLAKQIMKQELKNKENFIISQSRFAAMGEMISMIAHQWRQPISTISMSANNMFLDIELNQLNTEVFKENIQVINEQVDYLSKTIDDFRNFFKPENEKEVTKVEDLINDTLKIIGKTLQNNNINFTVSIKINKKIKIFKREFVQVLLNLIKNSKDVLLERHIQNPKISISATQENNILTIVLCDNGGGIKNNIKNMMFEPYFTTKNEVNGTGLGLYISKTIIEKHFEGSIHFENRNDGVCFFITFPNI